MVILKKPKGSHFFFFIIKQSSRDIMKRKYDPLGFFVSPFITYEDKKYTLICTYCMYILHFYKPWMASPHYSTT